MKKVKTLLVAAVAALSMTACSLDDIKSFPSQAGSKVSETWNSLLEKIGLKKKEEKKEEKESEACKHQDGNHDGVCDLCGETGLQVSHSDENHDHLCDVCGASVSQHADADNDFKCDECGADLAIASVRLDTEDVQKLFALNEEFTSEGLKVIATSEVGSEKELEFSVSQPDMSQIGDQTIVVTFGEGENDKLEYEINISYWSSDDLAVFEDASLTRYAPLPYLAGFNMHVEATLDKDGEVESWHIEADDITSEAYLEYYNKLSAFDTTAKLSSGKTARFKLDSVAVKNREGFHGLSDVEVFRLAPYTGSGDTANRAFVFDEYLILGVNTEGKLIVESRMLNSMLDGYFFGEVIADGYYGYPAAYNSYIKYLPDVIGIYYSELSERAFVVPTLSADATFVPMSYKSMYPLAESLDVYDLAWVVECDSATQADYDDFCAALLAAGYTYDQQYNAYYLSNDLVGYMEFDPAFYPAEGDAPSAFIFQFYFVAPDSYTNHLTVEALRLGELLNVEFDIDNDWYDYGVVIAEGDYKPQGATNGEEATIALARALLAADFDVTKEIAYNDEYKQYTLSMTDGTIDVSCYVDEEADSESGAFGIELYIYDAEDFSLTNAEKALQAAFVSYAGERPLKGEDYVENEDGSFTIQIPVPNATAANEQYANETVVLGLLGSDFEIESSEAGSETDTWVTVYKDVNHGVQVTATAAVAAAGGLLITVKFENHVYITPESTMIDLLTALKGSAPAASDYVVSQQDTSVSAEVSKTGEFVAADLQTEAEAILTSLGEGFAKISSEAGENSTWVAVFDNATTNIRVIVTAALAEGGITLTVVTDYIPAPRVKTQAELYLLATLANFGLDDQELGEDYYQYDDNEYFYTSLVLSKTATGTENLQDLAEYYAGAAPAAFTLEYYSEASTQSYYQVDSWEVYLLTADYAYSCVFEVYVVGTYLVLSIDVFAN